MEANKPNPIRVAVLSDLHCISSTDRSVEEDSYLRFGQPGSPVNQNPVEALLRLIHKNDLRADLVLCPGDLTNKACPIGYHGGLAFLERIKNALGAERFVVVTGNHDVDSRHNFHPSDSFHMAREVSRVFPFLSAPEKDAYWSKGFLIINSAKASVVAINTCADHTDERSARRGTFSEGRIERLDEALECENLKTPSIALFHHHPNLFGLPGISEDDILQTGQSLLTVLAKHGVNLVVHGHRHFPHITHIKTDEGSVPVFGAGSFSRALGSIGTYARNLFQMIYFEPPEARPALRGGWMNTWEYSIAVGWQRATDKSASLPFMSGFGEDLPPGLAIEIGEFFAANHSNDYIYKEQLLARFPILLRLLPSDWRTLAKELKKRFQIVPVTSGDDGSFVGIGKPIGRSM